MYFPIPVINKHSNDKRVMTVECNDHRKLVIINLKVVEQKYNFDNKLS